MVDLQDDGALLLGAQGQGLGPQVRAGFQLCRQPGDLLVPPPQRRLQQHRNYRFNILSIYFLSTFYLVSI